MQYKVLTLVLFAAYASAQEVVPNVQPVIGVVPQVQPILGEVPVAAPVPIDVSQVCLGCICEAASGCNTTVGCAGDICGPFHITWGYWADSGKPTLNGQPVTDTTAFANCVNDAFCAANSVKGYMQKYAQDCNGDGVINCDDFARIHYLGGYGCSGSLEKRYETAYYNCRSTFKST